MSHLPHESTHLTNIYKISFKVHTGTITPRLLAPTSSLSLDVLLC